MTHNEAVEYLKHYVCVCPYGSSPTDCNDKECKFYIAINALETGEVYMSGDDYNLYMEGYKQGRKDFETPKIALETIQKHCEHQESCMDCPINQVCDFCFMGQPEHWDLSEVKDN